MSALHPSQRLQHPLESRDKNYINNFNYQNVLPLFNAKETIRPTTYRPQLLHQPTTINHEALQDSDHRFSQKQTNGYLPLNDPGFPSQRRFPPPSVQIIPSIALSDDNGLVSQNRFGSSPALNQQLVTDAALYNRQLQYEQFRNGQPPFYVNVQDEQFAYQRPIRKNSDRPPVENGEKQKETDQGQQPLSEEQHENEPQQPLPNLSTQSQPELFQIPLLPKGSVSVSTAILADEFEQTLPEAQPQLRQSLPDPPQEFLVVPPQFLDNGVFSTDFGPSTSGNIGPPPATKPNPQPLQNIPPFTNSPNGSFSRFAIGSGSEIHESLVTY